MIAAVRGFSLIEVVVALFVVATVLGAAVSSIGAFAANQGHLELRSEARWVAANRLTEAQLGLWGDEAGESEGSEKMGWRTWYWRMQRSLGDADGHMRISVEVFADDDREKPAYQLAGSSRLVGT